MITLNTTTDELSTTSDEPDSPHVALQRKPTRASQDTALARAISEAAHLLQLLESDPEVPALLQPLGIGIEELTLGRQLQQAAQSTYTKRQLAMGQEQLALSEARRLTGQARAEYYRFREIARAWIELPGGAHALGLKTRVAMDRQSLLTQLRASYSAAAQPSFQNLLGRAGYTPERLADLQSDVTALERAYVSVQSAQSAAKRATRERDEAAHSLQQWVGRVKRLARRALQDRPELFDKLASH